MKKELFRGLLKDGFVKLGDEVSCEEVAALSSDEKRKYYYDETIQKCYIIPDDCFDDLDISLKYATYKKIKSIYFIMSFYFFTTLVLFALTLLPYLIK